MYPFIKISLPDKMTNPWSHITRDTQTLLQTSNQPCRKKTWWEPWPRTTIAIQRSLISGNIWTMQDTLNLLEKVEVLEAQDEYRKLRQNSDRQDANRRPQYDSQGDRTDRTRRDSMQVQ
jgi:hypothetical protein